MTLRLSRLAPNSAVIGALLIAAISISSPMTAWATSSGGGGSDGGSDGRGDTGSDNPPGSFNPDGNPFGGNPGGNGVPPHDGDHNTAPFGQGYVGPDGSITIESPPGTNWGPQTFTVPFTLPPMKTYDWVDGAVMATSPAWALHNLSLLYKAGKMTAAEYAMGVAGTLGVEPGKSVTIGNQ